MTGETSPEILVVGEALIDVLRDATGQTVRVPGGSPANVAFGLARLGVRTAFLGHLAPDSDGAVIVRRLEGAGVAVLPETMSAARTPVAEVTTDAAGQATYRFAVTWELPQPAELPQLAGHPSPQALHIGSYSAFAAPGADAVLELATSANRAGIVVSFDPNIRPALIGDPAIARRRFEQLAQIATVVKLSDEDAAWLYPAEPAERVLARLAGLGVALGIVTRGERGSLLATGSARADVPAATAQVVDTVGAGDSYMAALLSGLAGGGREQIANLGIRDLRDLGRRSSVAAALTVSRRGAEPPTAPEVSTALGRAG